VTTLGTKILFAGGERKSNGDQNRIDTYVSDVAYFDATTALMGQYSGVLSVAVSVCVMVTMRACTRFVVHSQRSRIAAATVGSVALFAGGLNGATVLRVCVCVCARTSVHT
jgi:hypothetical protein